MDSVTEATQTQDKPTAAAAHDPTALERAEIRGQILKLAGPALVEYFLMTFTGIVNMIMVGSLGAEAITSVGITNQPIFFVQAAFMSLSVGTTALVARCTGAGDINEAKAAARQSIVATALLGLVVTLPQVMMAHSIVKWMGAEPGVLEMATRYMQVIVSGTIATVIPLTCSAILRGAGDCRTPMTLNILMNVLNAAFGFTLIYGYFGMPRLGVTGAAVGTVMARTIASVLFLARLYNPRSVVPLSIRESHRLDFGIIDRIMHVGIPTAIEQFIMRGGQTMFARTVASLGTLAYAAHQLTVNAESLAFNPPMAFQVAATTLTGQYLGAKRPDAAERAGYENLKMSLILMAGIGTMCYVFAPQIMRMYTNDADVIAMAVPNMRLFSVALPGMAMYFVLVGALRGAGDTKWPLYMSIFSMWLVRVMMSHVLAIRLGLGLRGAWMAMVLDHCVRAASTFLRYRSGAWKLIKV